MISGLWHGANWTFIIWGFMHGSFIIIGKLTMNIRSSLREIIGLNKKPMLLSALQIVSTFILVNISWVFFRASNIQDVLFVFNNLFIGWDAIFYDIRIELQQISFSLLLVGFLIIVHFVQTRINIREAFSRMPILIRWSFYYIILFMIINAAASNRQNPFIYFQF